MLPSLCNFQYNGKQSKRTTGHVLVGLIPLVALILMSCSSQRQTAMSISQQISQSSSQLSTPSGQAVPNIQAAQPGLDAQDKQIATQVNALFTNLVAQDQFSGSVLIAKDGQILLTRGYSMADWQTNTPNTPLTRFYLGSVTKEFTAMSILILQEEGKLDVHKPICTYVIPCPAPWQPVTLHEVLTHTSGIPEMDAPANGDAWLASFHNQPSAWIASFDTLPLAFTPGTEFGYCSSCYEILAYVVQRVSGQPYSQFVQQHILTPLHMGESGFDSDYFYSQAIDANGYNTWQSSAEQLGWGNVSSQWSFLFGSGLLYSTVGDLYRWDQALYTNVLVNQQTRNEAFTSYTNSSLFFGSTYGYGWFIAQSPVVGHRLIWHDGVIDGFRTYIGRYIDDDVTIIFLSNLATVDSPILARSVQGIVFAGV